MATSFVLQLTPFRQWFRNSVIASLFNSCQLERLLRFSYKLVVKWKNVTIDLEVIPKFRIVFLSLKKIHQKYGKT